MIRVIDILNRTDRNKCGKSKDFVVQNDLLGINVAGGGAAYLCSALSPVWTFLTAFPSKSLENFSVKTTASSAVAGVWACVQNADSKSQRKLKRLTET